MYFDLIYEEDVIFLIICEKSLIGFCLGITLENLSCLSSLLSDSLFRLSMEVVI